jgi:hypothetical protein
MPSTGQLARVGSVAAALVGALSLAGPVAAQFPTPEFGLGSRLASRFGGALLVNLVLSGLLLGLAPEYARRTVGAIRDDPGSAFLWGLLVGIALPIGLVLVALTIIGLLITIPGLLALAVLGIVGNAVAICWFGSLLTGGSVDVAAVGAGSLALAAVAAVPVLGNLATTLVGLFGLGVVGRDVYTSWKG